jgi:hypothetical protein
MICHAGIAYPHEPESRKNIYLKTNLLSWGAAVVNASVEVDLASHWSLSLPAGYSAWNYLKSTYKFRTLAVQPEVRYWISGDNEGIFVGAHAGVGSYNFAFDGQYRYQDHDRRNPAVGGGLSVGYRMPVTYDGRWYMEFSLGAGVYHLYYDVFRNTPVTRQGLLVDTVRKTYWGLDQASITFCYRFDLKNSDKEVCR